MSKKALVCKTFPMFPDLFRQNVPLYSTDLCYWRMEDPSLIFKQQFGLANRPECEVDEEFLQLIPYVTMVDKETGEFFIYTREKGGNESRLHGSCSIGIGGHIEEETEGSEALIDLVAMETAREIVEEVNYSDIVSLKTRITDILSHKERYTVFHYRGDAVGRVHLALHFILQVNKQDVGELETGVLSKGMWLSIYEIEAILRGERPHGPQFKLEPWSLIAMGLG